MKLAIVGSFNFCDYNLLKTSLQSYHFNYIISGGKEGADHLAEKYAWQNNKILYIFLPDWKKYGASATSINDQEIVNACNGVLAFWDGKSAETISVLNYCQELHKPYKIINF